MLLLSSCSDTPERGGDPRPQPPAGPLTYVSLGDSLAIGVGASDPREHGYAPIYREELARSTDREVRLVQLGVSGETSETFIGEYPDGDSSQLARALGTLEENPGARVTLSLGGNDLLRTADLPDPGREAALLRYRRNLDYILGELGGASEPAPEITVLALYNPAPGSFTDRWVGRLNDHIRETAAEHGVRVAAGDRAFRGHEDEYAHHARYPWDIHPTDSGYRALARAFVEASEGGNEA
jgi:lysophospholipase L1-like esterase